MADAIDIRSALADIVAEVSDATADDVQPDKSFVEDLGVDSLAMVEVIVMAEDAFGVRIPDNEVGGLSTVGVLVAFVERAQAQLRQ